MNKVRDFQLRRPCLFVLNYDDATFEVTMNMQLSKYP